MHADTLGPGTQLAGRYRIEDLVGETARSRTWRALDRILDRSVSVQVVHGDDEASEGFLTAARAATAVEDPRFLRVLDAAREDGHAYVVREWARGVSLDTVLQQGPLPAPRAVEVVREAAEAVAAAHRAGLQHCRIDPSRIIVKHNGAVRVLGLATDQALHAPFHPPTRDPARAAAASDGAGDPSEEELCQQADVTALGRLLYACLVARWPGGRDVSLPAAPTEHGRLLRPRQVRAGVDPVVDTVVDRVLGAPPRHHAAPLRSAADIARELTTLSLGGETGAAFVDESAVPHAVLPLAPDPAGPPPAIHRVLPPRTGPSAPRPRDEPAAPHTGARAAVWVGLALLLGLAIALAVLVGQVGSGVLPTFSRDDATTTDSGQRSTDPTGPLRIESVSDFDPQGTDGGENPEEVPASHDSDPATAWTTSTYFGSSELGNLKPGVGLLIDLGRAQDVRRVDLTLRGGPTSVSVYAEPTASTPPSSVAGLDELGDLRTEPAPPDTAVQASVTAGDEVSARWLVVWLTDLPPDGAGNYEGSIAELAVVG